ncbi:MAG: hypothetical protein PHQ35_09555 [Phycisphaerae bacterium]|nr:hypothetical protein [Phycisphaerae bacterium]MDD5239961.1 hypothetical protein [Candidatus Nanoarchaeia archaeon]
MLTRKQLDDAARCCKNEMDEENRGCICDLQEVCGGVPAICVEKAAEAALAFRDMLERLEWIEIPYIGTSCLVCGNLKRMGHADDCALGKLLGEE